MSISAKEPSVGPAKAGSSSEEGRVPASEERKLESETREGTPQPIRVGDLLAIIECTVELAARTGEIGDQVTAALEQVATGLEGWSSAYHAQARQAEHLTRRCEELLASAAEEKGYLIDQQDQFLASLLDDHERTVEALQTECDRAWRKVGELQARVATRDESSSGIDSAVADREELSREVLLRAKQQRDEAQRQTIEALSRLQSALAELERLKTFAAPSTLPPSPELPISLPPEEPLRAPAVPKVGHRTPSTQPAGWRRSVPPVRRESASRQEGLAAADSRIGHSDETANGDAPSEGATEPNPITFSTSALTDTDERSPTGEPVDVATNSHTPPRAAAGEHPHPSTALGGAGTSKDSPGSYSMPAARAARGSDGSRRSR